MKILFYILVFLFSCAKDENGFRKYTIKKGEHGSNHGVKIIANEQISGRFYFDESARYLTVDQANQMDINKLIGLSDHWSNHTKNSARLGWRYLPKKDSIQVLSYCHISEKRDTFMLTQIAIKQVCSFKVRVFDDMYFFNVNNVNHSVKRDKKSKNGLCYKLYPYFGGDEVAPQDINIFIRTN